MDQQFGKWIILGGVVLVLVGIVIYFFGDRLSFLGRLPGDIRIEREGYSFYFPITTMILLSIVLSVLLRVINSFR